MDQQRLALAIAGLAATIGLLWLLAWLFFPRLQHWLGSGFGQSATGDDFRHGLRLAAMSCALSLPLVALVTLLVRSPSRSAARRATHHEVRRLGAAWKAAVIAGYAYFSAGVAITLINAPSRDRAASDVNTYLQGHFFDPLGPAVLLSITQLGQSRGGFVRDYLFVWVSVLALIATWVAHAGGWPDAVIVALVSAATVSSITFWLGLLLDDNAESKGSPAAASTDATPAVR